MNRMRWAGVVAAMTVLAVACGDDPKKDRPAADSGADGDGAPLDDAGADASVPEDSGEPSADRTPPTFSGATGAEVLDERKVRVEWTAASDDHTPSEQIAYRVYRATESGGHDFDRARRCATTAAQANQGNLTEACYLTAPAGSDGATFVDILPGPDFFFVARAIDAAGNEDANTVEVAASTSDTSAPEFGGVRSVQVMGSSSIAVSWGEAYDKPVPASLLVYHVYVAEGRAPDPDADSPVFTSAPGERSTVITDLKALTNYFVIVRVEDPDGNVDTNARTIGVTTPEGIPPTFDGLKFSLVSGTSIRLFWIPATDNVTEPENIVYDIWQALSSRRQNFNAAPTYTSDPGVASWLITDLEPGTRYFFIVRARDIAGNRDANTAEENKVTGGLPDNDPPSFGGVTAVTALTPSSLAVTWGAANEAADFLVYVGAEPGVPLDRPTIITRQRSTTLTNLAPGTRRYVVVRARDAAGNIDPNTRELSATTLSLPTPPDGGAVDVTPPTWVLGPTATRSPSSGNANVLDIAWDAAFDDSAAPEDIRYHVCASTVQTDCVGNDFYEHVQGTTEPGTTTFRLGNLIPRTEYHVFVRPEDPSGNIDTLNHEAFEKTATSFVENVTPILVEKCIACHSGSEAALLGQPNVSVRDVVSFTNVLQIRNVASGFEEIQACEPPLPADGCFLKLIDPGRPEFSLIYRKVNQFASELAPFSAQVPNVYSGLREPRDTEHYFTVQEDQIVREWIEQGAVGN